MQAGRTAIRRWLHFGRKIRHRSNRNLIEQTSCNGIHEHGALIKKIVRLSEWTEAKEDEKTLFQSLQMSPKALTVGILHYTDTCITTNTQFDNIVRLLSSLPCLRQASDSADISAEEAEDLFLLFQFLDSYAYEHYFEISDIYPAIGLLLKLQAFLNDHLSLEINSKFGTSVISSHLPNVVNSRRLKTKTVELFMNNAAKYCGQTLESKESAEIAEIVASSPKFDFKAVKSILTVKFRSWFKSIAIPKNDEYLDFLRRYDLSVERILDLLEQFILAANQTRKLKALNVETRNTEYDQFLVFLFRQLGEALDLEFLNTSDQLASKLSSQECLDKISSILNHSEKLANLKSLFKDELALLKEIKDGSSNKSNDTL